MSTHLEFEDVTAAYPGRKTKIMRVVSKHDKSFLGEIRWHGPWRQYVFIPYDKCIWSHDCLLDLSVYVRELMQARKEMKP